MSKMLINFNRDKSGKNDKPIRLPRSKSIAARMLILDYIRGSRRIRTDLPDCDDTRELSAALQRLDERVPGDRYDLGSGGTSLRFFTALVASMENFEGIVDCSAQMRGRPLAPLVESLRGVGADIIYMDKEGHAPIYIRGKKLRGGEVVMAGDVSSQFVSALLMASHLWETPIRLNIEGAQVSHPYIAMTERMIKEERMDVIETDWSAAAFFYELCLVFPDNDVVIEGLSLPEDSVQGDAGCERIFDLTGVKSEWDRDGKVKLRGDGRIIESLALMPRALEFDMGGTPDLVPALAVGMALAGIKFRFGNVSHLRHKESDRLTVLQMEMAKIGYVLEVDSDSIAWHGRRLPAGENEVIDSHGDHRIAMAFAMAAAKFDHIAIAGAECVAKSFPGFFEELGKIGFLNF